MKVILGDGRKYIVYWSRRKKPAKKNSNKFLVDTICTIKLINENDKLEIVGSGTAYQSDRDNNRLHIGRKVSLTKALGQVYPYGEFNKSIRKQFWDIYRYECRIKPRKHKMVVSG